VIVVIGGGLRRVFFVIAPGLPFSHRRKPSMLPEILDVLIGCPTMGAAPSFRVFFFGRAP
jgi:hypothetical protein